MQMLVKLENGKLVRITADTLEQCDLIHKDFMSHPNHVLLSSDKDITGEYKEQIEVVDFKEAMDNHIPVLSFVRESKESDEGSTYILHAQDNSFIWYEGDLKRNYGVSASVMWEEGDSVEELFSSMEDKIREGFETHYKILAGE